MLTSFTSWLVVLAVLTAYLCPSVWLCYRAVVREEEAKLRADEARLRADEARLRVIEREYPARAFDISTIAPQIRHVRQDYAASSQRRWHPVHCRAELISAVRRLVTSRAYFRHASHDHELHKHDA